MKQPQQLSRVWMGLKLSPGFFQCKKSTKPVASGSTWVVKCGSAFQSGLELGVRVRG